MPKLFLLLLLSLVSSTFAQDTIYARKVIQTLCSPSFKGRGYIGKGDKKAAGFIESEFKKIGLKPLKESFRQNFNFSANTIQSVEIEYNGKLLVPGIDYLVDASSPSFNFNGEITFVNFDSLNSDYHYDISGHQLQYAILDTFTANYAESAAINMKKYYADRNKTLLIRLSNQKLTWTSASYQTKFCGLTIRSEIFDRNQKAHFKIKVKSKFYKPYTSQNILGMVPGTDKSLKDSFIFFTAHYDHLGKMGKAVFPGANDNASGIAMLLNLAKYYVANPQKYSIVFVAFSGEEIGLVGSHFFVKNPLVPLEQIRFLINIDLMANGADGIMAVNGLVFYREFVKLKAINDQKHYLPDVKVRGKAQNSDHYYFSEAGVHCFFFYLMGNYPYYHDINDTPDKVPLTNFIGAFNLMVDFVEALQ
jgi:hypothetical protein